MNLRFHFTSARLKELQQALQRAYRVGTWRQVRRITALLLVGPGNSVEEAAEMVGVHPQTLYRWLKAWLTQGMDSLK